MGYGTVDGDTVRIAVENNPNLEGRSALLTIKAGQDSTNVTIQQQGMAYKYLGDNYYVFNDSARSLTLPLNNEGGVMSVEAPDGVSASFNDSTLSLSLGEQHGIYPQQRRHPSRRSLFRHHTGGAG